MTVTTSTVSSVVMQTSVSQQLLVTNTEFSNPFTTTILSPGMSTEVVNSSIVDESVPTVGSFTTSVDVPSNLSMITFVGSASTAQPLEKIILLDSSMPIAYAGYENKIKQLDYTAGWPPVIKTAATVDILSDWEIRSTLSYS